MGVLIIVNLVVTEVALGIHARRIGRHLRRAKAITRAAALGVVTMLVSLGVLEWSPRYHTVAAWLGVLALAAAADA